MFSAPEMIGKQRFGQTFKTRWMDGKRVKWTPKVGELSLDFTLPPRVVRKRRHEAKSQSPCVPHCDSEPNRAVEGLPCFAS